MGLVALPTPPQPGKLGPVMDGMLSGRNWGKEKFLGEGIVLLLLNSKLIDRKM